MPSVWISDTEIEDAAVASPTPAFIVKVGGVYYVTKAVWEFDPAKAGTSQDKIDGCNLVKGAYGTAIIDNGVFACKLLVGLGGDISHTSD